MTISTQIIEVLDALCAKLGIAIDWTAENVLPYAEEFVAKYANMGIGLNTLWLCLGAAATIVGIVLIVLDAVKWDYAGLGIGFGGILIIVGIALGITSAIEIIVFKTFPEKAALDALLKLIQ